MEWLENILKDVEGKEEIISSIKKELPKNFIPKTEFNEKNEELKSTKAKMDELQKSVEGLDSYTKENEELKTKVEALKNEYEQFKADADTRVKTIQVKQAIERNLVKANANPDTIDLLVNQFDTDKLEVDSKGDIVDWDVHFTPIKEQRKSLFGEVKITGDKPTSGANADVSTYKAKYEEALNTGNRTEAIKIKQEAFKQGEII